MPPGDDNADLGTTRAGQGSLLGYRVAEDCRIGLLKDTIVPAVKRQVERGLTISHRRCRDVDRNLAAGNLLQFCQ